MILFVDVVGMVEVFVSTDPLKRVVFFFPVTFGLFDVLPEYLERHVAYRVAVGEIEKTSDIVAGNGAWFWGCEKHGPHGVWDGHKRCGLYGRSVWLGACEVSWMDGADGYGDG